MARGKVKEYNSDQGYGSILDFDSGKTFNVYANYVHLENGETLKQGQDVEYDIERQRNESWAINVRLL